MKQPMLAATADTLENVLLPCWAQFKLDGIRCIIDDNGHPLSRKMKPIPNRYVYHYLDRLHLTPGLDGELMVLNDIYDPDLPRYKPFNSIQSEVMSEDGCPQLEYVVFDINLPHQSFGSRWRTLLDEVVALNDSRIVAVTSRYCKTLEDLTDFEDYALRCGMEGIILRQATGLYKEGRSTLRQNWLVKYKRFHDSEARVIGFNELMTNMNTLETDERGYAKRSKCQEGMVPADTLGNLIVEDTKLFPGVTFEIGTGFTAAQRKEIWSMKEKYIGGQLTYKYQKHGTKDRPRIPVFKAWRYPLT